ncbi:hypothetical protein [Liberiplasma polymorphum]|uniref:hypothetical protein n=1 Tax=Liberiplasma polymorphum TaxID=3374570 RepID=UPI003773681F
MFRIITDYLRLKRRFYHLSEAKLKKKQEKWVLKQVNYAVKYSPYYFLLRRGEKIKSMEAFYQLPVINKKIMMDHFSSINTCKLDKDETMAYAVEKELNQDYLGYYKDKYVIGLSSGTSGNKGLYITPKKLTKRLPGVFLARGGLSLKELPFNILFLLRVFSQGFEDINAPFLKLQYMSTMSDVDKIIEKINNDKINILMAPPSLIRFILTSKRNIMVPLKKVVTYAEVLTVEEKVKFEQFFKTKVIEIYQASEGQMASACKHGHLHINEDLVFVELYDEYNQPIKQEGIVSHKMIITNLINRAQPLIRYEMNDRIILDSTCTCGSNFRRIKKVLGRDDDLVYVYDQDQVPRVVYPDLISRWIITESDAIREFQVVQESVGKLILYIDLIEDLDIKDLLVKRFEKELAQFGYSAEIEVIKEQLILPKDKNKFKRFISKLSV